MKKALWHGRVAAAVAIALVGAALVTADGRLGGQETPQAWQAVEEAPDSASALAAARRQRSRVRVADMTTETRLVHAKPDGTMTAELTTVPVRVKRGNAWLPVDTTLEARADGTVGPKVAVTEVAFSGGGDGPLVRYGVGASRLTLSWPGLLPKPVLVGNAATYPEVYPGVDLVMKADHAGYTQHIVVKGKPAAAAAREFRLGMAAEGVQVTVTGDGSVEGHNADGEPVFRSPPSLMWDSAQARKEALAKVSVEPGTLVITPDAALLDDPQTTYPVTIDPAPAQLGKSAWGGVYSGNPAKPYYNSTADPAGTAQVGQCNWANCGAIVGVARTYFQFDTRWLRGKTWIKSFVNVVAVYRPDCGTRNHHLYWVNGQYGSGTAWNSQPGHWAVDTQSVAGARSGCANPGDHHFGFDTKGHISFGDFSSYFIGAANEGDSLSWRKYDPHRTVLYIEYNTPPGTPTDPSVSPWRAPCANCGGKTYLGDDFVTLHAWLSDEDGDQMSPFWRVNGADSWGDPIGSGDQAAKDLDLRDWADQTEVWWKVWAVDAHWSHEKEGPGFVVDRRDPVREPTVTSDVYPMDNRWHGGVNVPGSFTFTPVFAAGELQDIDHYRYGWDAGVPEKIDAPGLNQPVTVRLTPPGDGPRDLYVHAVDRAGRFSPVKVHHFYVRAGSGPLAQWSFEGSTKDSAFMGFRDGQLHGGAYTPGAVGSAVTLDPATQDHVKAPNTVNTTAGFSVSAWVRLDTPTGARAVVSQSGDGFPGFVLWQREDAGVSRWVFGMPGANGGGDYAVSSELAQPGVWTHLAAVHDPQAGKLRIYVNGVKTGEIARASSARLSTGVIQIGRTQWDGRDVDQFGGAIDEVSIWDRVLSDTEVRTAVSRDNVQVGHWRFDEAAGSKTAGNAVNGGAAGVLHAGAQLTTPGIVDGSLKLDGTTGSVTMGGPQLRTDRSFTVAAWVELARQVPDNTAVSILAQDGVHATGMDLHYRPNAGSPDSGKWWILLPGVDQPIPTGNTMVSSGTVAAKVGQRAHVAAVYDAGTRLIRLYVDGQLVGEATRTGGFNATGTFAIGRSLWNDTQTNYFPGLIDEVRAYSRPLAQAEIQGLVSQNNVTEGQWRLDGGLTDTSGKGRHGTKAETIAFTSGQTSSPDPADLALSLNANGFVSAPKALDTSRSFSVSAWARMDRLGNYYPAVVSQDGTHVSTFALQATDSGRWAMVLFPQDNATGGPVHHRIVGSAVQVGVWTHLVGMYDASTRQIHLYVNGVLAASGSAPAMWNHPTGGLQIGAAKWAGQRSDRFPGAIDDVAVYNRTLFAEEVRTQAGRDLSLVHNWTFDEPVGTSAGDSVGSRTATLSGGYQREVGQSGNAMRFNGGAATTSKVDLRTDQSFTVSAWVKMDPVQCADPYEGCRRDAVTVDGTTTSKFRLGHLVDDGDNLAGSWIFEMPESDETPAVARAAVSVAPGEIGNWVHLVGVYDAPSKTIWLYVDAVRQKDGALDATWEASGGVAIGRGKASGQAANPFPGAVDDVRLYAGVLDKTRVAALRASYPTESATASVPTDQIGYWKLDDNTGTVGADSSGNNRPVTATGGAGWLGGRKGAALKLDGTTAWAQTAGPVIDTTGSFSVAAWTYLDASGEHNRTLVAQDANRVSAFYLHYHRASGKWAVLVPSSDVDNPQTVLLTSAEAAAIGDWTHLAMTYHAPSRQLKLYVNGVLSAMRAEVATIASTGPLTLGRSKWNGNHADRYKCCIDEVHAFNRVLRAAEVRAIHDDVPAPLFGRYTFDNNTTDDFSWRANHATPHTAGVSYGPGVNGRAMVLDGQSGRATTQWLAASTRDSFTVSAWANLSHKNQVATVVAQDGARGSSFFIQYRPAPDRWVFGHHQEDADAANPVYAQSLHPAATGKWTHLTGVYDHPARQLRLYVDGQLAGTKENVALWVGNERFNIGRSKVSGAFGDFFPGSVDEVSVFQGVQPADDITRMGWPNAPSGQLGRFVNTAGDHYTGSTSQAPRAGYHFEGTLGALVTGDRPNTRPIYACMAGTDAFTSIEPTCEGRTVIGEIGRVYTRQPTNVATIAVYRCNGGRDHFESRHADCEGVTTEGLLGYTLAYASMGRYHVHSDHWMGLDHAPYGYRYEGPLGWVPLVAQPGTVPLSMCMDGADQFLSTDRACAGKTVVGMIGEIWSQPPSGVDSKPVYSCRVNGQRFVDFSSTCSGYTVDGLLGHVLYGAPNPAPVFS